MSGLSPERLSFLIRQEWLLSFGITSVLYGWQLSFILSPLLETQICTLGMYALLVSFLTSSVRPLLPCPVPSPPSPIARSSPIYRHITQVPKIL
jgi:hypothetical protein